MFEISGQIVFNVLLIAVGAIAVLTPLAIALRSRSRVQPVLAYQNIPELSKLSEGNRNISVTFAGRPVERVTTMRIWFWNAGGKPLRSEDIPAGRPLTITFREPGKNGAMVLDFRTIRTTGPDIGFLLERTHSLSTLKLNFSCLDRKCGALCEVQHAEPVNRNETNKVKS